MSTSQLWHLTLFEAIGKASNLYFWTPDFSVGFVEVQLVTGHRLISRVFTDEINVKNFYMPIKQELALNVPGDGTSLRLVLWIVNPASGDCRIISKCGILLSKIRKALPLEKYFDLFHHDRSGGGYIRMGIRTSGSCKSDSSTNLIKKCQTRGENTEVDLSWKANSSHLPKVMESLGQSSAIWLEYQSHRRVPLSRGRMPATNFESPLPITNILEGTRHDERAGLINRSLDCFQQDKGGTILGGPSTAACLGHKSYLREPRKFPMMRCGDESVAEIGDVHVKTAAQNQHLDRLSSDESKCEMDTAASVQAKDKDVCRASRGAIDGSTCSRANNRGSGLRMSALAFAVAGLGGLVAHGLLQKSRENSKQMDDCAEQTDEG